MSTGTNRFEQLWDRFLAGPGGREREELWRKATRLYPNYDAYQRRAGARRIPVMVLEPEG